MPTNIAEEFNDDLTSSVDPYKILGLEVQSTAEQIKTAYRKQALKHHPDKANPEDQAAANSKFQEVALAYAILSDPKRRSRYDATGNTSESLHLDDEEFNWTDFFRSQKAEMIDGKAIQKIKEEYQHSSEERADLIIAFEKFEGDMDAVYEEMMCSNVLEDDKRFRDIIDEAISKKEATPWKNYKKETRAKKQKRAERARKEADEALEYAEELGVAEKLFGKKSKKKSDDTSDLAALIQQRQKGRENALFEKIEAKYGDAKKSVKGRKRVTPDEPSEEAFERNRKRRA